jgi:hypothetical protein
MESLTVLLKKTKEEGAKYDAERDKACAAAEKAVDHHIKYAEPVADEIYALLTNDEIPPSVAYQVWK